ncbi:D-alanyl-D-alanine carboxypeptidase family protein [Francisella philomiragia]|uniref:D-alanyl-D-alanine carboxypeptidase family protein n=1 Tax=Francisella philomiragia TaxID=28110 RepID=UPI0001AF76F4|nr:D-alanyl-D-alanine carboxypeptidase family protein [Francisella philomiragia]AJI74796.1 D-alanyl-D-alanine carboxypeptidase family protein [Francisella philomiragia subsp. philomiragia ATCC 25015]EET21455.1 D-alanyl-D-alanine carboxypeptidase [Francisella philomiragia subsp. philomiragia ATCC 25015]MBK2095000.1 D-alanyl-D-alanine carboxypeptidase [Francisella philomiragia]MBK2237885.1 D-alanyl-D-alanine carboxypeptidase [Francisella philomiragia]QUE32292.1 D-alanyl-D-alanine carboxypeptidas
MKFKKIALLTASLVATTAFAAPNISSSSDPYFNGGNGLAQKDIIVRPVNIELDAPAWVAMNYRTGDIVSQKNMDVRRPPASLTKIMTSYIVASEIKAGNLSWDTMVPISEKAASTGGSKMYVKAGAKVSVKNLVTGMDVVSGNDATIALAEYIGGTAEAFTDLMNQTAKAIGMNNTHFANPDGLPGGEQYTTAHDMALLARSYIYNFPDAYKIYDDRGLVWNATQQESVSIADRKQCLPKFDRSSGNVLESFSAKGLDSQAQDKCSKLFPKGDNFVLQNNRNRLLFTFDGADGMKTGHTDAAGYCLVSSAKQDGERFISVVLGTSSSAKRDSESSKLLRYAISKYENVLLYKANSPVTISADNIPNAKAGQKITVASTQNIYQTVPKTYIPFLKQGIVFTPGIKAPIKKGQTVGELVITLGDTKEKIASVPVVSMNDISQRGWW